MTPNPSRSRAVVRYRVDTEAGADVHLSVIDGIGCTVLTSLDEKQEPGPHAVAIETANLAPGWYVVRLQCSGTTTIAPIVVGGK